MENFQYWNVNIVTKSSHANATVNAESYKEALKKAEAIIENDSIFSEEVINISITRQ